MGPLLGAVRNLSYILLSTLSLLSLLFFKKHKNPVLREAWQFSYGHTREFVNSVHFLPSLLMPYFRKVLVRFQAGARREKIIWGRPLSRVFKNPESQGSSILLVLLHASSSLHQDFRWVSRSQGSGIQECCFPVCLFIFSQQSRNSNRSRLLHALAAGLVLWRHKKER